MQALNLFGVQSTIEDRDSSFKQRELQKAVSELMNAAVLADPHGDVSDFSKRKPVAVYDPYANEEQWAFLKLQDEDGMKASLVVDAKHGDLIDLRQKQSQGKIN